MCMYVLDTFNTDFMINNLSFICDFKLFQKIAVVCLKEKNLEIEVYLGLTK